MIEEDLQKVSEDNAATEAIQDISENQHKDSKDEKTDEYTQLPKAVKFLLALLLLATVYYCIPKFHNLTVELGTDSISLSQFANPYAIRKLMSFVSDPSEIDINNVGSTEITLRHLNREETVVLSVVDTTAPEVVFVKNLVSGLTNRYSAEDFVESVSDFSPYSIKLDADYENIDRYGDYDIKVTVEDESGNQTEENVKYSFIWLKDHFTVEYGTEVRKEDLLYDRQDADQMISDEVISMINSADLGQYTIESSYNDRTLKCLVTVQDTTPPDLQLKDVSVIVGKKAGLKDFIVKCEDNYSEVTLTMNTELDFKTIGQQQVEITATDANGNSVTRTAVLRIKNDDVPPVFSGLSNMTVAKYSTVDYTKGVRAKDNIDGTVSFTYDASKVKLDKAGTYYVTYTAVDSEGNRAVKKRKITVLHDSEDTKELCDKIFAKISDRTLNGITNYIHRYVGYGTSWGGDDPVWYGLTNRRGNCYVHALIMQEMLNRAGIENMLIYTTTRGHYWNLAKTSKGWYHADAMQLKGSPPLVCNDETKMAYLLQRPWGIWDTSKFPASGD